ARVEARSRLNPMRLATDLDGTGALRAVNRLRREVQRAARGMGGLQLEVDIDLDDEAFRRVKDKLEDLEEDLEPSVDPEINEAFYRRAQMRLAWLTRPRFVTIIPRVSNTAMLAVSQALARLSGA